VTIIVVMPGNLANLAGSGKKRKQNISDQRHTGGEH